MSPAPAIRALVTGVGAVSPLAGDAPGTWAGMLAGRSGTVLLEDDWARALPVRLGAPAVDPVQALDRVRARTLDRCGQLALAAAREAWADAGAPDCDPERLAVVVGTGIGGITTLLTAYDTLREHGARRVSPHAIPMLMPNGPAAAIGLELTARGGVHCPVSACASGAEAVAMALELVRSGRADVVVCGGTEASLHPLPMAAFAAMRALSTRESDPAGASRPYDRERDGFVLGEGAGILVVERAEHAAARGARAYAELAGAGMTSDAYHVAAPDPVGAQAGRAVREALADADAKPDEVTHVNAHATGTPLGDTAEARALRDALGSAVDRVAVSATKSTTGHLLGAAGAVEAIACVLALANRLAPPVRNLTDPEPGLDLVRGQPRPLPASGVALSDSFGFGGHNVCLTFRTTVGAEARHR